MTAQARVFVPQGSPILRFARALSWLWRLGPVSDVAHSRAVGIGTIEEAQPLHSLLQSGQLAGVVVFGSRPGPDQGPVPGRQRLQGVADFGPHGSVRGQFTILHGGGDAAVTSSLGVHARRDGRWLVIGADPISAWGTLDGFWILETLADFFVEVLERPLVLLPPIGMVRYDDVPGTASQQIKGTAKPDRRAARRIRKLVRLFARAGAKLNVAVSARALRDGDEASPEDIWPRAVAALADGVRDGVLEPVCHGYLHLDTDAWASGRLEPREFASLDEAESARRLERASSWMSASLGAPPRTFVAPNWAYGPGLLTALAERGMPAWLPAEPGPLLDGDNPRETLASTLDGLHGLDYRPLASLAEAGLPPTMVVHGGLFDSRLDHLGWARDFVPLARLAVRRDLFRAPWVEGVRWLGASEMLERFRDHDRIVVDAGEVSCAPGTDAIRRDREGISPLRR